MKGVTNLKRSRVGWGQGAGGLELTQIYTPVFSFCFRKSISSFLFIFYFLFWFDTKGRILTSNRHRAQRIKLKFSMSIALPFLFFLFFFVNNDNAHFNLSRITFERIFKVGNNGTEQMLPRSRIWA